MVVVSGTDKIIIGSIHCIPDFSDLSRNTVDMFFRSDTGVFGFFLNLLSVFIGTGAEEDIVAFHPFVACNCVGKNDFIGIANVGF